MMNEQYSNSFSKQFREDQEEFLNIAIKKWKFHKNFKRNLIIFSLIGIFLLVFAIVFLVFNLQIVEVEAYYGDKCKGQQECEIDLVISSEMSSTIFVYYQLENFYRKNRNYYKSKSIDQLRGNVNADISSCGAYQSNKEMNKTISVNGLALNSDSNAFPCGEIAYTYFTDTFRLFFENGTEVVIDESDIAWASDRESNFRNPDNWQSLAWTDIENEHFMVWMRTAGQGRLKKLWGRINTNLPKGNYQLKINNTYDTSQYFDNNIPKSFFMTTTSAFGQKNMVLVGSYFAGAFICLCSIIVLVVIYYRDLKRKIV